MKATLLGVLIVFGVIGLVILYKVFKPYFIKHDTTLCITGGLGSGKTLHASKKGVILIRKQRFYKYYCYNLFKYLIWNFIASKHNKRIEKVNNKRMAKGKKPKNFWHINPKHKKPLLYSNYPIHFKTHIFGKKKEWSSPINERHMTLLEEMREYSVVIIDEFPQFINQFNWSEQLVQKNVNEWITFFRHYIGGYFICTSQSTDDIVVQVRRKLNQAIWCFDFHKWLFGLFYTVRMCDIMLSDEIQTMSTTYIEENTKLHFGLFPRKMYDTRCYSERYKNILLHHHIVRWDKLKTNKIIRVQEYVSPLDDETSREEKLSMKEKADRLARKD